MIALLQAGYYAEPHAARYDAATMGMFVLIIAIGIVGFIVQRACNRCSRNIRRCSSRAA